MPTIPETEGVAGGETKEEQVTTLQHWKWNAEHHWKHWHGLWTMWIPCDGLAVSKTYKSVRSLWRVDEEAEHLYHRNQWYETSGEGPDIPWEGGPWAMYHLKHSQPNGIWHPNSQDHRILQFPNGDLGWVQLSLKPGDPKCVIFNELHFMASADARLPVIFGYNSEAKVMVAMMLEETRDSDKRPEPSWRGTIWKHHMSPLEESRKEPEGTFIGMEMALNTDLLMCTRKALWKGFKGGMNEDESNAYILIHLPYGVTVFAPKEAAIGKEHAYYVSWVVNESQVRLLSARYLADGKLHYVKSGTYYKTA